MTTILTPAQAALVAEERAALERLAATIESWEVRPDELRRLQDATDGLDEIFLLVVAGEFNSGKSALINALLGGRHLEMGVTPTTHEVQVLTYGDAGPPRRADNVWHYTLPVAILAETRIVDTPGTNAIQREHEALTREFVPRADLVLFVTSADRPFTESERSFLEAIRAWGKKIVFVINKVDLLDEPGDLEKVVDFVRQAARKLLGEPPTLFPLSARGALRAIESDDEEGLAASGWPAFLDWLRDTLTAEERVRLKLESPLGVAEKVAAEASSEAAARLAVLNGDRTTLDEVSRTLEVYRGDMREQLARRLDRVDTQVLDMRGRGEEFLEEHFRLTRLRGLMDADRLRAEFEEQVIGGTPDAVAAEVSAMIDWIIDREHEQWRGTSELLAARAGSAELKGAARGAGEGFAARRQALLGSVGGQANTVAAGFDANIEGARLVQDVQEALASTALVEVGALGLGIVLKAILGTAVADATGILAAGVLAAFGLTIIPYRRRQAANALRERIAALREELRTTLTTAFERELDASSDRMTSAIEPYGRFVRAETARLDSITADLDDLASEFETLRRRIAGL